MANNQGAAIGAAAGTLIPGVGNVLGAAIGGTLGGLLGGHPKDAARIQAAQSALQRALSGDQSAYTYMMQQAGLAGSQYGSATPTGKQAFQMALKELDQRGGVGGINRPAPAATGPVVPPTTPSVNNADSLGAILRRLNGGKALTPGNLLGGGVKNVADTIGGVGGTVSSALSGLTGGGSGGGISPLVLGLAGLQAANATSLGKKSNEFADKAFSSINDSYAARAGLRDQGIKGLMAPPANNVNLAGIRNQNPVAAKAQGIPLAGAQ